MRTIKLIFAANEFNPQEVLDKMDLKPLTVAVNSVNDISEILWNCRKGDMFEFTEELGFPKEITEGNSMFVVDEIYHKLSKENETGIFTINYTVTKTIILTTAG